MRTKPTKMILVNDDECRAGDHAFGDRRGARSCQTDVQNFGF